MDFDAAVARFLEVVGANMKAHYLERFANLSWSDKPMDGTADASPPAVVGGRKYLKVAIVNGGQNVYVHSGQNQGYVHQSVYCFIERETGRILKAESWKKPSLLDRGASIYDEASYKQADSYGSWLYQR